MLRLVAKVLMLGGLRKVAKRPTAALETAAVAVVCGQRFLEPHLGPPGSKRHALLRAAHIIFLPAAIIKGVRLVRRLAGKRQKDRLPPRAAVQAAPAALAGPLDPLDPPLAPPARMAIKYPPLPKALPRAQWGMTNVPEVAQSYSAWTKLLALVLERQFGVHSLPPDFDTDGLELLRHLLYSGCLLAAHKPADGARALSLAAQRVVATINWRDGYTFMSPEELRSEWDDVVWWEGPDENGTLWLHLHLARAVAACGRGQGSQCVQAVVSQLEHGVRALGAARKRAAAEGATSAAPTPPMSTASSLPREGSSLDALAAAAAATVAKGAGAVAHAASGGVPLGSLTAGAGGGAARRGGRGGADGRLAMAGNACAAGAPGDGCGAGPCPSPRPHLGAASDDRLKVVVVGAGSNVRQALRLLPLLREFSHLVQRHYPGRLRAMFLAELPRGLRMSVGAVMNLLSAESRQKIKICKLIDLPESIATALAAREEARAALQSSCTRRRLFGGGPRGSGASASAGGAADAGAAGAGVDGAQHRAGRAALQAWALRVLLALLMSCAAYVLILTQQLLGPSAKLLHRAFVDR